MGYDVSVFGSELLLLLVRVVDSFGFFCGVDLSGVSIKELYSSDRFSDADDSVGDGRGGVDDVVVVVYGEVPDIYLKLCNSMHSLLSWMSSGDL